jgi:hypothetical protein
MNSSKYPMGSPEWQIAERIKSETLAVIEFTQQAEKAAQKAAKARATMLQYTDALTRLDPSYKDHSSKDT